MKCECCKAHIATGSNFTMLYGRPWIAEHIIEYRKRRRMTAR